MAYSDENWLITIRGNLPSGEVWANNWAVSGTGVYQDAVDALHTTYESWAGLCSDTWSAVAASARNLGDQVTFQADWDLVEGQEDTAPPLPTECALRVTVVTPQHHGGPFLCGVAANALDADGTIDSTFTVGFRAALAQLVNTDLPAADFALALNRPTISSMIFASQIKLGEVFDVIRRRRNNITEAYDIIVIT